MTCEKHSVYYKNPKSMFEEDIAHAPKSIPHFKFYNKLRFI